MEAVVILQVVHAPLRKGGSVLEFMIKTAGITGAGLHTGAGVHAKLQALAVDIVCHILHTMGELLRIRHQSAVLIPLLQAPAVVDDDILITAISKAGGYQQVGRLHDHFLIDLFTKSIPGIPSQGRFRYKHRNYLLYGKWPFISKARIHHSPIKVNIRKPPAAKYAAGGNLIFFSLKL